MPDKERNNKAKDETDESLSGGTVGNKRPYIEDEGEDSESKGKKPKVKFIILHMLLYICDSKINLAN